MMRKGLEGNGVCACAQLKVEVDKAACISWRRFNMA